jgi:acylpyruvate hydrolase
MKILCIGRNYSEHAKELNNAIPAEPMLFMKPVTALTNDEKPFYIPEWTADMHYEVELVVKIKKNGKSIHPDFVKEYYSEVGLGIDFTARDIQDKCKANKHPWEVAKAFDNSALVSKQFMPFAEFMEAGGNFSLRKNGEEVQHGHPSQMLFSIDTMIVYMSKFFTLQMGDLIFTGTPAGVGKVVAGDKLSGYMNSYQVFEVAIN